MSKRINVYLSDDDISILGDIGGKELIKLAKKGLSDTDNVSVPLSSSDGKYRSEDGNDIILTMLEKIYGKIDNVYDDTQKIVEAVEKKNQEQKIKSNLMKGGTQDMTMSMVWGDRWKKFKEYRDKGGASGDSGWEDFTDLVLRTPFNMIQKNIDEGKYILD